MDYIENTIFEEIEIGNNIENGLRFQSLVESYFKELNKQNNKFNRIAVNVKKSGAGADGGVDLIVTFNINDSISKFERKWVVQCKFLKSKINLSDLDKINIPSLVHSYGADGYLLICRNVVTNNVVNHFEQLTKNCKFKYHYEYWDGDRLITEIIGMKNILKQFFPKYYKKMQLEVSKIKEIK